MEINSFGRWESDILRYCEENGLDFHKASKMKKRWGIDFLQLMTTDPENSLVVLDITRSSDGGARCHQTDYTQKYLGN